MKVLGITGGVGSGKSRILYDLEKNHNALIIEADKLAHKLMEPGEKIYSEILKAFGEDVLSDDEIRSINRQKLGAIVFSDKGKLEVLNAISHPMVKEEIKRIISETEDSGKTNLIVIEAALLIEDGYKEICDEIWYVYVSREERIKRLKSQRGYTEKQCQKMFESQASDEYYIENSDRVIDNERDYETTYSEINVLLKKLI